jgi:hypothetical protein
MQLLRIICLQPMPGVYELLYLKFLDLFNHCSRVLEVQCVEVRNPRE